MRIQENISGPGYYNASNGTFIMGMGNDDINGLKDTWNNLKNKVKEATQKVLDTGKTVVLAAPRIAYLGLVKINVHKLATNQKAAIANDSTGRIKKRTPILSKATNIKTGHISHEMKMRVARLSKLPNPYIIFTFIPIP